MLATKLILLIVTATCNVDYVRKYNIVDSQGGLHYYQR
jgi:hypothetical protein